MANEVAERDPGWPENFGWTYEDIVEECNYILSSFFLKLISFQNESLRRAIPTSRLTR
jgi:hypothetical protein